MTLKTHLRLGRVSNLPTVWTNVLAASALAGITLPSTAVMLLLVAMSLFYVAGMYYNDACDADYDAKRQPHRPIPSGLISRHQVEAFALGYAIVGSLLVYAARMSSPPAQGSASIGWLTGTALLIACIIAYNRHHKNNPFSPLLMAACRMAVLITTTYALTGSFPAVLLLALLTTLAWLIGLTYLAKHEQSIATTTHKFTVYWPLFMLCLPALVGFYLSLSSPATLIIVIMTTAVIWIAQGRLRSAIPHLKGGAIALLIAGICLVDGIYLAWVWGIQGVLLSIIGFGTTLLFQRWVAGT